MVAFLEEKKSQRELIRAKNVDIQLNRDTNAAKSILTLGLDGFEQSPRSLRL